ncbi:MAG: TraX family protein [Rickettsiaceae bacterium]|nr:TraX family protein [Rickettsiaceae bacterium]
MNQARRKPNMQDALKFFALISMILDHASYYLLKILWLRVVGRFAFAIFLFFAGYNYYKKKKLLGISFCVDHQRYFNIFLWGVILQIIQYLIFGHNIGALNILISIIINLMLVDLVLHYEIPYYFSCLFFGFLSIYTSQIIDYGNFPAIFIILGIIAQRTRGLEFQILLILSLLSLLVLEIQTLHFETTQIILTSLVFIIVFLLLSNLNFEKEVKYRPLLISRYALHVYIAHILIIYTIHVAKVAF